MAYETELAALSLELTNAQERVEELQKKLDHIRFLMAHGAELSATARAKYERAAAL